MPRPIRVKHGAERARPASGGRGGGRPPAAGDVQLAWARDKRGAKVHAARLLPADRRGRAPFTCLGCGDELIPHLGARRARHFAHRAGSACPLTAPETALHLDAKERLLALCEDAFARRRAVTLRTRCASCRRLALRDLGAEGDAAREEGAVGALRADVLVTRAGLPALAIEVVVTHAVDAAKEAALAAAGVPAIEIDAREPWEHEEAGGIAIACARTLGFPPCAACLAEARAEVDRARGGEAAEIAELEGYRARGLFAARGAGDAARAVAPGAGRGDPDAPLTDAERAALIAAFVCPICGGARLERGERIVRHPCETGARPVAWRGYDGSLVELSWWRR